MSNCDILLELYPYRGSTFLVSGRIRKPETIRRCKNMNKYELAVVVSAKLEDEARADVIEK